MAPRTTDAVHLGIPKFQGDGEPDRLSFSPDGTRIAAGETRWTTVWSLEGTRVWTAAPGGHPVWLGDTRVLTTGFTNQPCVFSADTGELVSGFNATVHDAIALPGGVVVLHGELESGDSGLAKVSAEGEILAEEGAMRPFDEERRMKMGFGKIEIVSLLASANGARIAVSRRTHHTQSKSTLRVVDAELKTLWSRELSTDAMALDADGGRLAIAADGGVTVLDGGNGVETSRVAVDGRVTSLAFAPDGTLAIGKAQGGVLFVDGATGTPRGTFVPDGLAPDERVAALAFSPRGTHLAAGLSSRLTLRETSTGRELGAPPAHVRGTQYAAILPGAAAIVTRGATSTKVWTLGSGELKATHAHDTELWPVPPLQAGPGGVVFDAGADGTIRYRDALRWEAAGSLTLHESRDGARVVIAALSIAPDAKRLAALVTVEDAQRSRPPECAVHVMDLGTGAELRVLGRDPLPDPPPPAPDPELDRYRTPRNGPRTPHKPSHDSRVALSPDGKLLALTTRNEQYELAVHVVEVDSGRHRGHVSAELGVESLQFLESDVLLLETPGNELRASRIEAAPGTAEPLVQEASRAVLSPSRRLLASWNPTTGAVELRESTSLAGDPVIVTERVGVSALVFSEDDRFLGAILQDGSVRVWTVA